MNAEQLKATGKLKDKGKKGYGLWSIEPRLEVIATKNGMIGGAIIVKSGETYSARTFDEDGNYPSTVHLGETAPFWWPLEMFELKTV